MRKLVVTAVAAAGLALTVGCQRTEVQEERRDLAQAQREAQEEIANARGDVAEERRELAEAQRERAEELREEHSGATAVNETVQGRVQSTMGDSLVLRVPARNNAELKLKTDDQTRVTQNGRSVELDDFEEGTEVRASYVMEGEELLAREVIIMTPAKK